MAYAEPADHPPSGPPETSFDSRISTGRWGRISASWLAHPDIDADAMAVLAALSTYADRDGRCWPSQTTLANLLKRSRSWVNKVITRLNSIGLIEVRDRWSANGGRLSSLYQLTDQQSGEPAAVVVKATTSKVRIHPVSADDIPCSSGRHKHQNPEHIQNTLASPACDENTPTDDLTGSQTPLLNVGAEWQPEPADLAWASRQYPDMDVTEHASLFALRCQAHGYRYRDIAAAWKAWLVEDMRRLRSARSRDCVDTPVGRITGKSASATGYRSAIAQATGRVDAWAAVAARLQGASLASSPPHSSTPSARAG